MEKSRIAKSKRTGLPDSLDMRHDKHFVELISTRSYGPVTRMIPVEKIDPNPDPGTLPRLYYLAYHRQE